MKTKTIRHPVQYVALLLVFCLLAGCTLAVLLHGAGAYRRLDAQNSVTHERRNAVQYLETRIRQTDDSGRVQVGLFPGTEDCSALHLLSYTGTGTYVTYLYCHDGYLRELYAAQGQACLPEDGQKIAPMNALRFFADSQSVRVELTDAEGCAAAFRLRLRSGEGAVV